MPEHRLRAEQIKLYKQIQTWSCASGREQCHIQPQLFCQQMCVQLQTQSREPPASEWPASGKHPAQMATEEDQII